MAFWQWLSDHAPLIVGGLITTIAGTTAAYFGPRYSLLGKIVEQTENLRKASDTHYSDMSAKYEHTNELVYSLRTEVLGVRGELVKVRNENVDLIRHNADLTNQLTLMQTKYDSLLSAHTLLQAEHDTLKQQMSNLRSQVGS